VLRSALLLLAFAAVACGSGDSVNEPASYEALAEAALEDGLQPYWLGARFEAGGLDWDQIDSTAGKAQDGTTASIELHYFDADQSGAVDVVSMSEASFDESARLWRNPVQVTVESREANVAGQPIEFLTLCLPSRCPNIFRAILIRNGVIVVASTSSYISPGGVESNPLMEESAFLAVLENLRPYPE
jgi:hypothetical protein